MRHSSDVLLTVIYANEHVRICTDSVDQLCLDNSHTLKDSSGLPQVFYCLFEKATQTMLSQTLFFPAAKVAVRGNSWSPTSKLASSLNESLTAIADCKTN